MLIKCDGCGRIFNRKSFRVNPTGVYFCSRDCTRNELARFWRFVPDHRPDICWLWSGKLNHNGYGWFHPRNGTNELAHNTAWRLLRNPIPDGYEVCHNCGAINHRHCVNPNHLYLATHKQNMEDALKGGTIARGTDNGRAKLDVDAVRQIREAFKAGSTRAELARLFSVHWMTIQCVLVGKTWKHV